MQSSANYPNTWNKKHYYLSDIQVNTSIYKWIQVSVQVCTSLPPLFISEHTKKREPALLIPSYSFHECDYFTCRFQFDSDLVYMPKSWSTFQSVLPFDKSDIFFSCTKRFTLCVICKGVKPCINCAKSFASSSLFQNIGVRSLMSSSLNEAQRARIGCTLRWGLAALRAGLRQAQAPQHLTVVRFVSYRRND